MIELKDVFIKEDPFELNAKMNDIQSEKMKVLKAMMDAFVLMNDNRKKVHAHLRANYRRAIFETKKNAGMDSLELWAGSEIGEAYDVYIDAKRQYEHLDKIRMSYESDISALQSRSKIFNEVK